MQRNFVDNVWSKIFGSSTEIVFSAQFERYTSGALLFRVAFNFTAEQTLYTYQVDEFTHLVGSGVMAIC